jgi:hypothetical protein
LWREGVVVERRFEAAQHFLGVGVRLPHLLRHRRKVGDRVVRAGWCGRVELCAAM